MNISIYSTAWNVLDRNFDYKGALDNWAVYADQISIAIPGVDFGCNDDTYNAISIYANQKGYPVSLIETKHDFKNDPFAYGKTENSALQNCNGDLLIQQNLDERFRVQKNKLPQLYELLLDSGAGAYFVPTIDLYGSTSSYVNIGRKWYIHLRGYFRGAVNFGIKSDGHPDYNKTSTDELIDKNGNLVRTISLIEDLSFDNIEKYVYNGFPISYHLGYLNLTDRADRAKWWKSFWEKATNGDQNNHITSVEELLKRETKKHQLPLWPTK